MADMRRVAAATTEDYDGWLVAVGTEGAPRGRVSRLQHNTAAVQFAAMLDVIMDPMGVLVRAGGSEDTSGPMVPRFPTVADSALGLTSPTPMVGLAGTADNLQTMKARTGDAMFMEQRMYAGAMAWSVWQLSRARAATAPPRTTGVLVLGIPAGYYILTGVAASAVLTWEWIQETEETTRIGVVQAGVGQDYAARLAVYRATGSMPSPSERERAAATQVQASAQHFWDQLGRGLGEGAKTGSKWLMGAAAVALLVVVGSSTSKGA